MTINRYVLIMGLAVFAVVSTSFGAEAQINTIVNGDMEVVTDNTISGWHLSKPDEATCAIRSVESPVKNGKKALLIEGHGLWMSASASPLAIAPSATYLSSAWI